MAEGPFAGTIAPCPSETDRLRMHASGQLLILGWREGIARKRLPRSSARRWMSRGN